MQPWLHAVSLDTQEEKSKNISVKVTTLGVIGHQWALKRNDRLQMQRMIKKGRKKMNGEKRAATTSCHSWDAYNKKGKWKKMLYKWFVRLIQVCHLKPTLDNTAVRLIIYTQSVISACHFPLLSLVMRNFLENFLLKLIENLLIQAKNLRLNTQILNLCSHFLLYKQRCGNYELLRSNKCCWQL